MRNPISDMFSDLLAELPPWVKTRDEDRRARAAESMLLHGCTYYCLRCGDVLDVKTKQHLYGCEPTL